MTTLRKHQQEPASPLRPSLLPIFILALPLLEIAGFVVIGGEIGLLATLAIIFGTALAGAMLLRIQGLGVLRRIREETDAARDPGREIVNGAMIMLAGLLLLLPGFFTDVLGLLLFLPPVRTIAWRLLRNRVHVAASFSGFARRQQSRNTGSTIDLDREEYTRSTDADSPWRRIDRDDQ